MTTSDQIGASLGGRARLVAVAGQVLRPVVVAASAPFGLRDVLIALLVLAVILLPSVAVTMDRLRMLAASGLLMVLVVVPVLLTVL